MPAYPGAPECVPEPLTSITEMFAKLIGAVVERVRLADIDADSAHTDDHPRAGGYAVITTAWSPPDRYRRESTQVRPSAASPDRSTDREPAQTGRGHFIIPNSTIPLAPVRSAQWV
jgi:hypothetical protein